MKEYAVLVLIWIFSHEAKKGEAKGRALYYMERKGITES
jgi:hypothetical protein